MSARQLGGCAHGKGIDDHVVAGWNDDSLTGGTDGQPDGKLFVIALFFHHGNDDGAEGGDIGHSRTGDAAEEHAVHHIDHGKPTREPSHKEIGQIDQPLGDAPFVHDFAHDDEKGNGKEGEIHDAVGHGFDDGLQGDI